jgi:Contractile injection system tube protein
MERVAFLVERTGERLGCMLNPETLVVRRTAGVRARHSATGPLTGAGLRENPLIYTGGGATDLQLDLLFDTSIAGSSVAANDVRLLTRPFFELAEGMPVTTAYSEPPAVRFVWGKHWNVPGVVTAVAERLEQFTSDGAPQRSWLRMRLVRVEERAAPAPGPLPLPPIPAIPETPGFDVETEVHEILGSGGGNTVESSPGGLSERLDEIAYRVYGDARLWRLIAELNGIDNPLSVPPGLQLQLPRLSSIQGKSK